MLLNLKINNYLLINNCQIDFKPGLTIITGATGSGKSILLESLSLLIGERFNSQKMLAEDIYIEGEFLFNKDSLAYKEAILNGFDANCEIILSRSINKNSLKSVFRINGQWVNAAIVKNIFKNEIDIHSQFKTHQLFDSNKQHYYFDQMLENSDLLNLTSLKYQEYLMIQKELNEIETNHLNQAKLLLIQNQYEEINAQIDNLINYNSLEQKLKNLESELKNLNLDSQINDWISDNYSIIEKFSININDKERKNIFEGILNNLNELQQLTNSIDIDDINYQIDEINNQLFDINKIIRKYKMNSQELINYHQELLEIIKNNENFDYLIQQKQKELTSKYNEFLAVATKLSQERKNIAHKFEKLILNELKQLGLNDSIFKIIFNDNISELGLELISFEVSFNKNIPATKLDLVASGGELSRLMLALKVVLAKYLNPSLIIFDEIDSGVSGEMAKLIAIKCSQMSIVNPVIMITHLAIVACYGDNHYQISKNDSQVSINVLSEEKDIILSIVKLINPEINDINIEHAKNMLNNARKDKNSWRE